MGRGRQRIDKGAWGECHGVLTLKDAMARHGKPDIFNTDQGSQYTGSAFTRVLATNGITISMDGKVAWRDNVFVERLWRSVKYEEVYLWVKRIRCSHFDRPLLGLLQSCITTPICLCR